jgi:hypothetical protein
MPHARLEVRMESLLPFLQGTCTPYNMPVYPGAQCMIANALIESDWYREVGLSEGINSDERAFVRGNPENSRVTQAQ